MRVLLTALAVFLLPVHGFAAGARTDCRDLTDPTKGVVTTALQSGSQQCYVFEALEDDSDVFRILANVAELCFSPDADNVGAAEVMFQKCPDGTSSSCFDLADTNYTGAGGSGTTQLACVPVVGFGASFRIDVRVGPDGVETPYATLRGIF